MKEIDFDKIPKFAELPIKPGALPDSNWGVFGDDDEVGCVNFLTPQGVVEAAKLVRNGKVFRLDTPINYAQPPLFERAPAQHTKKSFEPYLSSSTTSSIRTTRRKAANGMGWGTSAIAGHRPTTTASRTMRSRSRISSVYITGPIGSSGAAY